MFWLSLPQGLRQVAGTGLGASDWTIPDTEDPFPALEHIAQAERGLCVLTDYAPNLTPFGQENPQLVRQLRELAWAIKSRPITVFVVGPSVPEIPALEKERDPSHFGGQAGRDRGDSLPGTRSPGDRRRAE